jgi:hypothetical protein
MALCFDSFSEDIIIIRYCILRSAKMVYDERFMTIREQYYQTLMRPIYQRVYDDLS